MAAPHRTHYEILGVTRNAKAHEIQRAYDRLRAEMRGEAAPPDARRVVQLQAAYEVLSDEARREAYDAWLREGPRNQARRRHLVLGSVAAGIVLVAAVGYFALRRSSGPAPRSEAEIVADLAPAVGRLQAIDLSGHVTPLGLAFAIDQGVLAAACDGLAPNMELVVRIGTRDVPARPADVDPDRGYCTLSASGAGSWPLEPTRFAAQAGLEVYAVRVGERGDLALVPGKIRRIAREASPPVVEVQGAASAASAGAPLLDTQGRVVAVADARGRYLRFEPPGASAGQTPGRAHR